MTTKDQDTDETPQGGGGRFLNDRPKLIAAGIGGAVLIVMGLVMLDRSAEQNAVPRAQQDEAMNTEKMVQALLKDKGDGLIEADSGLFSSEEWTKDADADTDAEPAPAPFAAVSPAELSALAAAQQPYPAAHGLPFDEQAQQIRALKQQQFQEAVFAKTRVQVDITHAHFSDSSGAGVPQSREQALARIAAARAQLERGRQTDPTAAYQQRFAALKASGLLAELQGSPGNPAPAALEVSAATDDENDYTAFDKKATGDRWQLNETTQAPRSPYEIRAGFILPATLISGINSDLPGQIMAQVAHNVFDTATGRHLLVPQGTRLIGQYSSDVLFGQERVLIAWQRLVFPDGKALDLGSMPGADQAGFSGLTDQVNNHYVRLFGSAFLMSGITAGVTLSQNRGGSSNNQRASDALSESLGQVFGQTLAQLVAKNLNIAPTLEVRPGYRFNVIVTKDLTFSRAYRAFDYSRR